MSDGLKDLQKQLQRLSHNAQQLSGTHKISFAESMPPQFMQRHSRFNDIGSFFKAIGISTSEDFDKFPQQKLDQFTRENTDFQSFQEMLDKGTDEWINHQMLK